MGCSVISEATGKRVFVIGDIHGCPNEPEVLLRHLEDKESLGEEDLVIFVGDYIDRGPNTKAVIDIVLEFKRKFQRTRFLKGNHEDMLLDFLGFGGNLGQAFLYNGGLETIQSYGMSVFAPPSEMVSAMPANHFKFFCELESIIRLDKFVCVHAGLNPLRELTFQNDSDVLWIREDFIKNVHSFKQTVIFGHTPNKEVIQHAPFKIGIDTGLVFGNKLTCLEIYSGQIFQVARESKEVVVSSLDMSGYKFD